MIIQSKAFTDGGIMPLKYTGFGEDVSPEFRIIDAPDGTRSFAIIMDDLDVPFRKSFNHWIIWNIPPVAVIPEGIPRGKVIDSPINAVQGKAWGKHIYRGPKQPLFIRKSHRYRFTVYALDAMLEVSPDSNRKQLIRAMANHIIESAELTGIYKPCR